MASNRGVAYQKPGVVEVESIDFPKLMLGNRKCNHGVILKIVSTNICGSDQHMVRAAPLLPKASFWDMKSPAKLSKPVRTLSSSRSEILFPSRSTSRAAGVVTARSEPRVFV